MQRTYVQKMFSLMGLYLGMLIGAVGACILWIARSPGAVVDPVSAGTILLIIGLVEIFRFMYREDYFPWMK